MKQFVQNPCLQNVGNSETGSVKGPGKQGGGRNDSRKAEGSPINSAAAAVYGKDPAYSHRRFVH